MTAKILGSADRFPVGAQKAYDSYFVEAERYCLDIHDEIKQQGIAALDQCDTNKILSYVRDLQAITRKEKWSGATLNKDHRLIQNSLNHYETLIFNRKSFSGISHDFDLTLDILKRGEFEVAQTQLSKLQLKEQSLKQAYESYKRSLLVVSLPTDAVSEQYESLCQRALPVFKDLENIVELQKILEEEKQAQVNQKSLDFQELRGIFSQQKQSSKIDLLNLRILFGQKQQGKDINISEDVVEKIDLIERDLNQTMINMRNSYNGSAAFLRNEERQLSDIKETIDQLREIAIDLSL